MSDRVISLPFAGQGRTRRQIAIRLLPFLFLLYIVNFLDRASGAYAAKCEPCSCCQVARRRAAKRSCRLRKSGFSNSLAYVIL